MSFRVGAVWFLTDGTPHLGFENGFLSVDRRRIVNANGDGIPRSSCVVVYAGPRSANIPIVGPLLALLPVVGFYGGLVASSSGMMDATAIANLKQALRLQSRTIAYAEGGSALLGPGTIAEVQIAPTDFGDIVSDF